jgi:pyruvate,water dikinase
MISAEPAQRVQQLAKLAAGNPSFVEKLCHATVPEIERELAGVPAFAEAYRAYLTKFGDRCLDELKLESATLHDDPSTLLRSIGQLAQRTTTSPATGTNIEVELRRAAEARVAKALNGRPVRRLVFNWVLRHTRARVRDRENLRFERTRLFGRVRRIFVAAGKQLHARGLLAAPGDVFYLELAELLGFCAGTATTTDLKGLTALRRTEFGRYREMEPPPDRFETRGPVYDTTVFHGSAPAGPTTAEGNEWKGTGCCPGIVRGPVRVIVDPRDAILKAGEILVAERTDPGWIMLFASAAGLLVERGSLLSHSAIVSREMGIPAIVSIPRITRELTNGQWVEMNGSTGTVKRIPHD